MNIGGGEAADQMTRMMLSGGEIAIRLTGSALKNCTLLTCTPDGVNTHRLLVRGVRMDPPEATEADEVTTEEAPQMSTWVKEYLFSLGASLAVVLVFFVLSQFLAALWRKHRSLS